MEEIMIVSKELEEKANRVSRFRSKAKDYLSANGACYDKFTITENDTFIGYISETAIAEYLEKKYGDIIEVRRWSDGLDPERIRYAVMNNLKDPEEINYVKSYFYDKYDLEIVEKRTGRSIFADVKSAETKKQPLLKWNYLYPVVQNRKDGKDCVILCYYYKQANINKIILVGYITEDEISRKKILPAGTKTKFGTVNQIDNYETKVTDYKQLSKMFSEFYDLRGITGE